MHNYHQSRTAEVSSALLAESPEATEADPNSRIIAVAFLGLMILVIAGCNAGLKAEIPNIKNTIQKYDRLLAEGYIKMDMDGLKEVATQAHLITLNHRLEAFKIAKRRMESELKSVEFGEIKFLIKKRNYKVVTVRTKEVWDIRHVDLDAKKTIKESKGFVYDLNYKLVKSADHWLVDGVEVLAEDKGKVEKK